MEFVKNLEYRCPDECCTEGFPALLYENMSEGVSINRIITDSEGDEIDYEIIDVNPAYGKILGISRERAVGSRASELYGFLEHPYLSTYVRVARTGISERLEAEYPALGKVLDITVFSPKEGYFAVIFADAGEKKETEERLELEIEEKRVLLREMHHRVKNNLTVVSSLLRLQAEEVKTAEDARKALEDSRNRVYSMALVHEKLYQTSCFSRVGMRSYVGDVVKELENHYCGNTSISFGLAVEDIHLDITLAVPVGIILNELLTNSLDHALSTGDEGRITVILARNGTGSCRLSVRESFPDNLNCLGFSLIRILTKQLGGNLSLNNGDGAEIEITFPLVPD